MARQSKEKADYFPHMATATMGKTLFVLESEYGNDGYAFWFKLLEALCQAEGHYIRLSSGADLRYLSARARIPSETAMAMLDLLAELEAIDGDLWAGERVVWCQNLVNNLEPLYQRRTGGLPKRPGPVSETTDETPAKEPEILSSETPSEDVPADNMQTETTSTGIPVDILHTETPENVHSADRNPQSKVKESRVKETKEKTLLSKRDRFDPALIVDLYHQLCPSLPAVVKITDGRKSAIKAALARYGEQDIATVFAKAQASDFLTGRAGGDRSWSCGIDWLLKPANTVKVLEGIYDNKKAPPPNTKFVQSISALQDWVSEG